MPREDGHDTVLQFPCDFPIKVMGRTGIGLRERVVAIVRRHVSHLSSHAITSRLSRHGNYVSITAVVPATSQQQLDDIYRELTACEAVLIAL
jgi:uncharacterized protein